MTSQLPLVPITGIGSVSPYGPVSGLIPRTRIEPTVITSWTTAAPRRAFLVPAFRPADIVPGVKTRRLDRLSVWALVASSLALKDAGIDQSQVDKSRVAVVFATTFGCVQLTEAFYLSAAANGWNGTDPITFPETLASAPTSQVAMFHGLRGPNITVSNKYFAGESAMIQAASLLRRDQADLAIVLAGDALARTLYSWYEEADLLSPACYHSGPVEGAGFIPAEGVAALVMESPARAAARRAETRYYARMGSGRWASNGQQTEIVRRMLADSVPRLIISSGNGAPCSTDPTGVLAREIAGDDAAILSPQRFAQGLTGTGALFHLILGLSALSEGRPAGGQALLLGATRDKEFAAIALDLPGMDLP